MERRSFMAGVAVAATAGIAVRREISADVVTRTEGVLEYEARGTDWTA